MPPPYNRLSYAFCRAEACLRRGTTESVQVCSFVPSAAARAVDTCVLPTFTLCNRADFAKLLDERAVIL